MKLKAAKFYQENSSPKKCGDREIMDGIYLDLKMIAKNMEFLSWWRQIDR